MPPEYALRAATAADVPAITRLFNRATEELFGESDHTEADVGLFLESDELDPAEDVRVIEAGGDLVGYADIFPHPHPAYWVDVQVPPSVQGELRTELLGWVERRVRQKGGHDMLAAVWAQDERLRRAFLAAGFARTRGSYRMRIDFDGQLEEPRTPDGVLIRSTTPDDARIAYETHMETFEDMWGHAHSTFEQWEHWFAGDDHDWSLYFLAESADGEPAGVALCRARPAEPDVGSIRVVGVRRSWRRKGVGRALMLHAFAEFRRRGMRGATLGVDAESLTGAQRLYASVGMYVERESDVLEKRLS